MWYLQLLDKEEIRIIKENYLNEIKGYFSDEVISIFDDSDISKRYEEKFEDLDKKLLTIKIIERRKSLKRKVFIWFSQISRGISEILKYSHTGIDEYQKIEKDENINNYS